MNSNQNNEITELKNQIKNLNEELNKMSDEYCEQLLNQENKHNHKMNEFNKDYSNKIQTRLDYGGVTVIEDVQNGNCEDDRSKMADDSVVELHDYTGTDVAANKDMNISPIKVPNAKNNKENENNNSYIENEPTANTKSQTIECPNLKKGKCYQGISCNFNHSINLETYIKENTNKKCENPVKSKPRQSIKSNLQKTNGMLKNYNVDINDSQKKHEINDGCRIFKRKGDRNEDIDKVNQDETYKKTYEDMGDERTEIQINQNKSHNTNETPEVIGHTITYQNSHQIKNQTINQRTNTFNDSGKNIHDEHKENQLKECWHLKRGKCNAGIYCKYSHKINLDEVSQTKITNTTMKFKKPCWYERTGKCKKGQQCSYSHDICEFYQNQKCKYGDQCWNIHIIKINRNMNKPKEREIYDENNYYEQQYYDENENYYDQKKNCYDRNENYYYDENENYYYDENENYYDQKKDCYDRNENYNRDENCHKENMNHHEQYYAYENEGHNSNQYMGAYHYHNVKTTEKMIDEKPYDYQTQSYNNQSFNNENMKIAENMLSPNYHNQTYSYDNQDLIIENSESRFNSRINRANL